MRRARYEFDRSQGCADHPWPGYPGYLWQRVVTASRLLNPGAPQRPARGRRLDRW
jgi:hypothetical protein